MSGVAKKTIEKSVILKVGVRRVSGSAGLRSKVGALVNGLLKIRPIIAEPLRLGSEGLMGLRRDLLNMDLSMPSQLPGVLPHEFKRGRPGDRH